MAEIQLMAPNNMAMPNAITGSQAINGAASGVVQFPTTSLYVGDLDTNVTDSQVFELFNGVVPVVSVRVCRDVNSRRSLGYAYVNFSSADDAATALEMLNFAHLGNKSIRIMHSNRDPSLRRSGAANIFIKNLDKAIDNKLLYETFSSFGTVLTCKVATDASGQSKGYGFVQYETEEAAKKVIEQLNGMLLNDKQVFVGPFLRKQDRENAVDKTKFNNVFVKNLAESTTKEELEDIFGKYGKITSAVVMTDENGKSRCFGFVNFENPEDAAHAVQELNGKKFNDQEWYVGRAQKKAEREMELKAKFDQSAKEAADKLHGLNLYLKNLDDSVSDDQLKELFSEYGTITSCKVMRDQNGISKGSGFVAFSTTEEADRALSEMNGQMVAGKPLYVALAQRKEDRRARLQLQFANMRPMAMGPPMGSRMPIFPPGTPGVGQQMFYGQGPTLMPPQPGFGFQPQMVPGMRPGGPMPNFFVPFVQPGQQEHRPGGRRGSSAPMHQNQQAMPVMHNQMMQPRGRMYRYPSGRNMHDSSTANMTGGMVSPYAMGSLHMRDATISQPMPISILASTLANANPDQQRMMLGESLYPLVDQLEHESAGKVTGMLLEMDQTEVLHLLESPEALKSKVSEAMDVLRNVSLQQSNPPTDQLGALSLSDGIVS